jgi:hypothetical protein
MRWISTSVIAVTLALVYWVGNRIYWWRQAFDGSAWTVTNEGVSSSLHAAGVLGLGDLSTSEGVTGIGSLSDLPTGMGSGQEYHYGTGGDPIHAAPPTKEGGITSIGREVGVGAGTEDPCTLTLLQLAWEQTKVAASYLPGGEPAGTQSDLLKAWCACEERTWGQYFRQCSATMEGWQGGD